MHKDVVANWFIVAHVVQKINIHRIIRMINISLLLLTWFITKWLAFRPRSRVQRSAQPSILEKTTVVKTAAAGVSLLDQVKQDVGVVFLSWIRHSFILGSDLAGGVVEVGPGVTRLKIGDRVIAYAVGMDERSNKPSGGHFQEYTLIRATQHVRSLTL